MRSYAKARRFLAAASITAIGFVIAPATPLLLSDGAHAQGKAAAESKTTTSTSPDGTYGQGGSLTTESNAGFKLLRETFKDKNGTIRETRIYPELGPEGQVTVILYDESGKRVGSYDVGPVNGQWIIDMYGPNGLKITEKLSKDEALKRASEASRQFAMTGEFPPLVKTNVEPPKLQQAEPSNKTPSESKTGANGTQGAAPKTCGEIEDRATLLAMGCVLLPGTRATAAAPRRGAPQATPANTRSESDCFSDAACIDQLKAQELLRERERGSGSGKGGPDYPPVDLPVPGGMPGFPAR